MSKLLDLQTKLQDTMNAAGDDFIKTDMGKKAAATRVRKAMQEVKSIAQEIRAAALATGKGDEKGDE